MNERHLHTYITRGTIVRRKDNLFDTENTKNKIFIEKRKVKENIVKPVNVQKRSKNKTKSESKKKESKDKAQSKVDENAVNENLKDDILKYESHRTQKMKYDAEMAKLKMQKLKGEVIPIDFAQRIFGIHFKNISVEFYNVIDNLAIMLVEQLKGNRKDLIEIRKKLKESLNNAVQESKRKSIEDLNEASKEFAEKKGRGEND